MQLAIESFIVNFLTLLAYLSLLAFFFTLVNCADITIVASPFSKHEMSGRTITLANLPGKPIIQPRAADGPPSTDKRL